MFKVNAMPERSADVKDLWSEPMRYPDDKDHDGYDYMGNEEMTGNSLKEASEKEYVNSKEELHYVVRDVQGEPTVVYPNGGMSSHLDVDYSLMPNTQFLEDVVEVLTLGCDEHGGKYPRDNWRKLSTRDNMVHALRHCLTLHGMLMTKDHSDEALMTELTHAVCRLWFLHEQMLKGCHQNEYSMEQYGYGKWQLNPDYKPKPPLGSIKNYSVLGDK